jgi:hypothetical protein
LHINDEEYLMTKTVAEMTQGPSNRAAHVLTTTRLYLSSPSEAPKNCGQIRPNLHDYHTNPTGSGLTFWIADITGWWHQQEETHSKYAERSNEACDIISFIRHGVGVQASIFLG